MSGSLALTAAVIKAGVNIAAIPESSGVALVPRLVVLGNGTGSVLGFNISIQNAGKAIAYGVKLGFPWKQALLNGSTVGPDTFLWEHDPEVRPWLNIWPFTAAWFPWRKEGTGYFVSKDVGLILGPTEQIQHYFGVQPLNQVERDESGIKWKKGQIIDLELRWQEFRLGGLFFWSRTIRLKLAISGNEGTSICAHTAWER